MKHLPRLAMTLSYTKSLRITWVISSEDLWHIYIYTVELIYRQTSNIRRAWVGNSNCWSLRYSWSITCRHCSNYMFIFNLIPGVNGLAKCNCKTRQHSLKDLDLVQLILEILRYVAYQTQLFPTTNEQSLWQFWSDYCTPRKTTNDHQSG